MKTLSVRCLAVASFITGFLYLSHTASAQITDTSKVYELEEVIISASRFAEDPATVGRNVTVITSEEIKNSIHSSVGDLLAGQQSVHVVGNGQSPGSIQSGFIRNSNSDNIVVMIDGVRISDPSSVDNSLNLTELSLANVQRIEIVRGSHSTLYGASAIGGVINIITEDKAQRGFTGNIQTKQGILDGDTYSTSNSASASYTWQSGIYANGAVTWQDTRGIDATIDTAGNSNTFNTADRDGFEKIDLSGKIGWENNRWDTFLAYRRADHTTELDDGSFDDDDNAFIDFQRDLFNYKTAYQLNDQMELKYTGAYSDLQRDFENDSSVVDEAGNFDGSFSKTHSDATLMENELTAQFQTGNLSGTIGLGNSRQTMSTETFTFLRPSGFESRTDLDSLDLKERINYAFVHTRLGGGLISESLNKFSLGLGGRVLDHDEFGTNATFEINPEFQITSGALVYGAVTTGFNAPSLFQLNSPARGFGAFTNRGNKELNPETSTSYELGWKQQVGNRINFNVSLFKTRVEDVIEFVFLWNGDTPVDQLTFADFLGDTYLNASEQNIKGIETTLEAQLTNKISLSSQISVTDSELTFSPDEINNNQTGGNHVQIFESGTFVTADKEIDGLTRRPGFSGNFQLNYHPLNNLSLTLTSRFVGERDDITFSSSLGPFGALGFNEVDSYNLTDLTARYRFNERLNVVLKGENLFDKDYIEINGFNTRGRGFFVKGSFSF